MSLTVEPAELVFKRPFTSESSQSLLLRNSNPHPIAFKIKTTAPKQYCVRPNSGRIEPNETVEVTVILQAMKKDPPLDAKCRDKFLVQSALITGDKEFENIAAVLDTTAKSELAEKKLRVVWLPASEEASKPNINAAITPKRQAPHDPDATSDVPHAVFTTPAHNSSHDQTAPVNSTPSSHTNESKGERVSSIHSGSRTPDIAVAPPTVSAATYPAPPTSATNAEVTSDSQLRQRKAAPTTEEPTPSSSTRPNAANATPVAQGKVEGVPVQMVAMLCLLSFLLAYFFF